MTMSNKQRAKIYRQAAELIYRKAETFCCNAIAKAIGHLPFNEDVLQESYPEIFVFEYLHDYPDWSGWWTTESNADNRNSRIIALLLSEQMALNPPTK